MTTTGSLSTSRIGRQRQFGVVADGSPASSDDQYQLDVMERRPEVHDLLLRAQWSGQQLRALRESTGMTLRQAGEYLQRDPSTVSRFESAEYPIRRGDVLALLDPVQRLHA